MPALLLKGIMMVGNGTLYSHDLGRLGPHRGRDGERRGLEVAARW